MEILKSIGLKKPIISMKIINDGQLVVIDSDTTVRFFDKKELSLTSGYKVSIKHIRYKATVFSFSNDGK